MREKIVGRETLLLDGEIVIKTVYKCRREIQLITTLLVRIYSETLSYRDSRASRLLGACHADRKFVKQIIALSRRKSKD